MSWLIYFHPLTLMFHIHFCSSLTSYQTFFFYSPIISPNSISHPYLSHHFSFWLSDFHILQFHTLTILFISHHSCFTTTLFLISFCFISSTVSNPLLCLNHFSCSLTFVSPLLLFNTYTYFCLITVYVIDPLLLHIQQSCLLLAITVVSKTARKSV